MYCSQQRIYIYEFFPFFVFFFFFSFFQLGKSDFLSKRHVLEKIIFVLWWISLCIVALIHCKMVNSIGATVEFSWHHLIYCTCAAEGDIQNEKGGCFSRFELKRTRWEQWCHLIMPQSAEECIPLFSFFQTEAKNTVDCIFQHQKPNSPS